MIDNKVIFSMVRVGRIFPPNNKQVLRDISLGFYYGAKIGVLGLNGAGKSTLLRIIAGKDEATLGEVVFAPGYSVGMLDQEPQLDAEKTVRQVVEEAVQPLVDMLKQFDQVSEAFADPDADYDALAVEQARLQEELEKHDAWTLENRLELAMDALRCPPGEQMVNTLSGGERRRVALTRLLLTEPDILLLDEPTSNLDPISTMEMRDFLIQLRDQGTTILLVTHRLEEVAKLTGRLAIMLEGRLQEVRLTAEENLEDLYRRLVAGGRRGAA
jgi:sulfate-transporting ATPase